MAQPQNLKRTYSLTQAAAILEMHRNTLARWIDQGCPVVGGEDRARGVEKELSIAAIMQWRVDQAVAQAVAAYASSGESIDIKEAQRRRAVADAIVAEIGADEALGQVVRVSDVAETVASEYVAVRSQLTGVGAKVAGRAATMNSPVEIQDLVDDAIRQSLDGLDYDRRLGAAERP